MDPGGTQALIGGGFVGRTEELGVLRAHLDAARSGAGRVMLVAGEAGMGKTRLLEESLVAVPRERALWGRCREGQGTPAYWPWIQAVRLYIERCPRERLASQLGADAGELARLVPLLATLELGAAPPPVGDPEPARFRLFDAVTRFLCRISADDLVVVALDDLHWSDAESLHLLRFLGPEIRDARLLVLGTYREREAHQAVIVRRLLADVARIAPRVSLRGLGRSEIETFVRQAVGDVSAEVIDAIGAATEGNPFFLREATTLLRRSGGRLEDALAIPHEVREVIRRRLRPLPADTRALLATAALLGREVDLGTLAALHGVSATAAHTSLAPALDAELIGVVSGTTDRFRFAHALVVDTLYEDLPAGERARLHRRAGEVLAARGGDDPSLLGDLAHHFFRTADRDGLRRAADYAVRAGDHARALLGWEEAAAHYERALEALAAVGADAGERLRVLLALGDAQACGGDVDGFRATFLEAAMIARERGDVESLARAALGYAVLGRHSTAPEAVLLELLEEARRALGAQDSALRARVLGRLSSASYYAYPFERRDALSREAVALARRLGDREALVFVLNNRHYVLHGPGSLDDRLAVAEETIRLAHEVQDGGLESMARINAFVDRLERGEIDAADRELAAAVRLAEESRLPTRRWHATVARALRALLAGRLEEAERLAEAAASFSEGPYAIDVQSYYAGQIFEIRRVQGRLAELAPLVAAQVAANPTMRIWRFALALIHAELRDAQAARPVFDELVARELPALPRDWAWLPAVATLAQVCAFLGDRAAAETLYALLLPERGRVIVSGDPVSCLGPVERHLGLLAATRGRHTDAVAHLEAAIATSARLDAAIELARAQLALARTLERRGAAGDVERARTLRAKAAAQAESLGLVEIRNGLAEDTRALTAVAARPPVSSKATLRRDGDLWTIAYGDEVAYLRDTKGLAYLAELLRHPGRELHALDLAGSGGLRAGDAGEVLDAEARTTYKRRLLALREELAEAEEFNDVGRQARLREEIEALTLELARAMGIGGRPRKAGSDAERARLNVTRAIGAVLKKVVAECPVLGAHLRQSVRTGLFCSYQPDARIDWTV